MKEFVISNNNIGNNVGRELINIILMKSEIEVLGVSNIGIDDSIHIELFQTI